MTTKQFEKLSPAGRRVAIAEDVIATLARPKPKRFQPATGVYFVVETIKPAFTSPDQQFRDLLPSVEKDCQACANGALFLSYIRLVNSIKVTDLRIDDNYLRAGLGQIQAILADSFTADDLARIEQAFESHGLWLDQYPDARRRLLAICRNVVRNKGDFRISEVVRPVRMARKRVPE